MKQFISNLLNIRQEEGKKVVLLVSIFFIFITGTAWAETIIESSFYFLVGVSKLSQVFTMHAILALLTTAVYSAFVDNTSNQKLLIAVCVTASAAIGAGIILLDVNQFLGYTILYVLVRAVRTAFVIHWWNYASDFYDARASKRIVPVINASSRFAVIIAGLTIPLLNRYLLPAGIILLWLGSFIVIALLSFSMNNLIAKDNKQAVVAFSKEYITYWQNIRDGFLYVTGSTYLRWLAVSTFLMVIVFGLLNYSGGNIFAHQFHSRAEMTNFIGYLNGLTNLVMLPVQLFLFSRIVTKIGVGNANVIFPFGTFLFAGSVIFSPLSLASGTLAHFDRNTFRYSTQESSNNLLYNAVPSRVKGRSRSFIDGLVLPLGLLTSSALLEIGKLLPANLFLPVLLGVPASAYFLTSLVIRKKYSKAMITLLEQEDLGFLLPEDGDITLSADPIAKNILLNKLVESQDDSVILLIARIMTETIGTTVMPILEMKTRESSPSLKAGIITLLAGAENQTIPSRYLSRFLVSYLRDPDGNVRLAAFSGLKQVNSETSTEFLVHADKLLHESQKIGSNNSVDFEIQSQALAALLGSDRQDYIETAKIVLHKMLRDPDPHANASALKALGNISGNERALFSPILSYLDDNSDEVRQKAAFALETRSKRSLPKEFSSDIRTAAVQLLQDRLETVRVSALHTLEFLHVQNSVQRTSIIRSEELTLVMQALDDQSEYVRKDAKEILVRNGNAAAPLLLQMLSDNELSFSMKTNLIIILCSINPVDYGEMAEAQILSVLKNIYFRIGQIEGVKNLPACSGIQTISTLLTELNLTPMSAIFELLAARYGGKPVQRIIKSLSADSSHTQANASEALEALISPALVKLIIPLYDPSLDVHQLTRIGISSWADLKQKENTGIIEELAGDQQNELIRALTIFSLGEITAKLKVEEIKTDVQTGKIKRRNLLDKLFSDDTKDAASIGIVSKLPMNLQEIQILIHNAQTDNSPIVRGAADAALRASHTHHILPDKGEIMTASISVIERIIFLKQVTLFQSMNIEQLKILASICEDEFVSQNTIIYKEGDPGGVVYIIVNGRVGLERKGDRKTSVVRLATLEAKASFGEMNLFEDNLRNTNAIAIDNCLLLKLRAEPFLALIRQHPDMSIELIKVLNFRLNEANDQIAHLTRSTPRQLQTLYDKLEDIDE